MLTIRKIRVASGDWPAARRAARYAIAARESPATIAVELDRLAGADPVPAADRASTAIWLGTPATVAPLGVEVDEPLAVKALGRALQGRETRNGDRLRREGWIQRDQFDEHGRRLYDEQGRPRRTRVRGTRSVDLTFSAPKSVSVVWSAADPALRAKLEAAMLDAAASMLENMTLAKPVVPYQGALRRPRGFAAAVSLHVLARAVRGAPVPAPQLHAHCLVVGVERPDGLFAAPELWGMFTGGAPLEGGAVGRAMLAERLVDLGFRVAQEGRYFEIAGVPAPLLASMSSRTREVTAAIREREADGRELGSRERAVVALVTRLPKGEEATPATTAAAWAATRGRFGFDAGGVEALRDGPGFAAGVEKRRAQVETVASGRRVPGARTVGGRSGSDGRSAAAAGARRSRVAFLECAAGRLRLAEALAAEPEEVPAEEAGESPRKAAA